MPPSPRTAFLRSKLTILLAIFSSALYAVLVWFVKTSRTAIILSDAGQALDNLLRIDAGLALAILRVMQGLLTLFSSSALSGSLELVQHVLYARADGLCYISFLVLSPATGILATMRILISTRRIRTTDRVWALTKLSLTAFTWLAALLLFIKTSRVTVYDTIERYNVTAGVGPFNASYLEPYFQTLKSLSPGYPYQVLPYTSYANVYNLIVNPTQSSDALPSPLNCSPNRACTSYFLSGGIIMATPWLPDLPPTPNLMARLQDVQGVQFDFETDNRRSNESTFSEANDCETYGADNILIAIKVCLKIHESDPNKIQAGLFVCENGITALDKKCSPSPPSPGLTTTMGMSQRRASILATVTNYTIASTNFLSSPPPVVPLPLMPDELASYRRVLAWLLNYTATDIPAPSSIAQNFWSSSAQLADDNPLSRVTLAQSWHSLLAFPVWMFNANNYGNPALQAQDMIDTLPEGFYTQATIVVPHAKLTVDERMLVWFLVLQGCVLAFIWGVLVWVFVWGLRSSTSGSSPAAGVIPELSSFVVVNSAFRVNVVLEEGEDKDGQPGVTSSLMHDRNVLEFAARARAYHQD